MLSLFSPRHLRVAYLCLAAAALLALRALAADGEPPRLAFPLDCTLGQDCHIQQFVDREPGDGATDFACGTLSYDGHKGTDFALPNTAAMETGVAVLAAAPGTVRGIRDEMPDIAQRPGAPSVAGRECGNGVAIDMGGGWEAQYCHMKLGSVRAKPGQRVEAGEVLGLVGLSGNTQFPHLHLSLRHNGQVVDPFDPDGGACGDTLAVPLWSPALPTSQGGLISVGFYNDVPGYDLIRAGEAALSEAPTDMPALVVWADFFGVHTGDIVRLQITGPEGMVLDQQVALERTQAQAFRASGRRTPSGGWMAGAYTGTVTLLRDGNPLDSRTATLTLEP